MKPSFFEPATRFTLYIFECIDDYEATNYIYNKVHVRRDFIN